MKVRIFFVIVAFVLIAYPETFAQKDKKDSKVDVKNLQLKGADILLNGINELIDYLIARLDSSYYEAQRNFNIADSIFAKLLDCCSSSADTAKLNEFRRSLSTLKEMSLDELQKKAQGNQINFMLDGRNAVLTKEEAGLATFLKILQAMTNDFKEDLTTVYFSHVWRSQKGRFRMRASIDRSWLEKLNNLGLGDKFIPVVVLMTNKLGRDVVFNPFTEKFTIITSTGKQFQNVDPDFDTAIKLEDLQDEEKQMIFDKVIQIYDGANTPIVLLFPSSVSSPENWLRIVFDTSLGEYGESLSKGKLNKEQ